MWKVSLRQRSVIWSWCLLRKHLVLRLCSVISDILMQHHQGFSYPCGTTRKNGWWLKNSSYVTWLPAISGSAVLSSCLALIFQETEFSFLLFFFVFFLFMWRGVAIQFSSILFNANNSAAPNWEREETFSSRKHDLQSDIIVDDHMLQLTLSVTKYQIQILLVEILNLPPTLSWNIKISVQFCAEYTVQILHVN